jgi:uncharacterized protein (TIGR02246 family)
MAVALVVAACSGPAPREFGKTDVDSITKLVQAFTAAYNAKDPAQVAALFASSAGLMPPNAPTVRGLEAIQGYFASRFAQGATGLAVEAKDIAGSGGLAYASGDYSLKLAPAGGPEQRDRGKFLWVLRDFDGRWLLEHVMFSSDFPPAPPPT